MQAQQHYQTSIPRANLSLDKKQTKTQPSPTFSVSTPQTVATPPGKWQCEDDTHLEHRKITLLMMYVGLGFAVSLSSFDTSHSLLVFPTHTESTFFASAKTLPKIGARGPPKSQNSWRGRCTGAPSPSRSMQTIEHWVGGSKKLPSRPFPNTAPSTEGRHETSDPCWVCCGRCGARERVP
mmetsp:Transcript_1672/g.4053  ORF Transcript_1672/g.4053 Transcript_1672/m.4053 type:complete len:180 (-) Transcript_1672:296-835(-)